jgi:5'(3')-deoxyribonucleotidase
MVLAVDCDNILLNLTEKTLELYNKLYDDCLNMKDVITYDFYSCLSKEKADKICELFLKKELWDSLTPISGSQKGINALIKAGHTILITTATHENNLAWKCELIKKFYPSINPENIVRVYDKSIIRADVIIDDDMGQLVNSFAERVCLDYIWNRSSSKDCVYGIHRAYSWSDIVNIINKIDKEMKKYDR